MRVAILCVCLAGCYDIDALSKDYVDQAVFIDGGELDDGGTNDGGSVGPSLSLYAGTLGGSGCANGMKDTARFETPYGVAVSGNLVYVTDQDTQTLATVTLDTHVVTRVAGEPFSPGAPTDMPPRLFGPFMATFDDTGLLYIAQGNGSLLSYTAQQGLVTVASGNTPLLGVATIQNKPFVTANDETVKKVTSPGFTTLSGQLGKAGDATGNGMMTEYSGPSGMTSDDEGMLYVADNLNGMVRTIEYNTGTTGGAYGSWTGLHSPVGIVRLADATIYATEDSAIVDVNSGTVVAGVVGETGAQDGTSALLASPTGIAASGSNLLVFADGDSHTVRTLDLTSKEVTTIAGKVGTSGNMDGARATATFNSPMGLFFASGMLYVADEGNSVIRGVEVSSGMVSTFAELHATTRCTNADGSAPSPIALTGDNQGGLYVADQANGAIIHVPANGASSASLCDAKTNAPLGGLNVFGNVSGIAFDGTLVWLTVSSANELVAVDPTGATATQSFPLASIPPGCGAAPHLVSPQGLVFDAGSGNLYIAAKGNCEIVAYNTGTQTTMVIAGSQPGHRDGNGTNAEFAAPTALWLDGTSLYVTDVGDPSVRLVDLSTSAYPVTTLAGVPGQYGVLLGAAGPNGPARVNNPQGVVLVPDLGLVIADAVENSLLLYK